MTAGDWNGMTDAEIMLRVRDGDDAGYDILIEKYRKPMINFMYRMVHNQAMAEELAQEVFLRVYRSRQTYGRRRSSRPGCIASRPIWQ